MLVAFAGRKQAGKSIHSGFLAKEKGFKELSFAAYLKELCCEVFNLDHSRISDPEYKEQIFETPFKWDVSKFNKFVELTKSNKFLFDGDLEFKTIRGILEYIGTGFIRRYDPDFHINKVKETIDKNPHENFACNDCRFTNEMQCLIERGAKTFYVIRPTNLNYSNYPSENSLSFLDFDHIIVNDCGVEVLEAEFLSGFEYGDYKTRYESSHLLEANKSWDICILEVRNPESAYLAGRLKSRKESPELTRDKCIPYIVVLKEELHWYREHLGVPDSSIYYHSSSADNMCVVEISSPYIIESLKYWDYFSDITTPPEHLSDDLKAEFARGYTEGVLFAN